VSTILEYTNRRCVRRLVRSPLFTEFSQFAKMPAGRTSEAIRKYRPYLVALMKHKYPARLIVLDTPFTMVELGAITPEDIYGHMCMRAYGKVDPDGDDRPAFCRSSTLEFCKKALSSFMPNRIPAWNVLTLSGNPTKSILVNDLIKAVKKHEVRKEGVESKACRPLELSEYENLMLLTSQLNSKPLRYGLSAFYKFQFAMIARGDGGENANKNISDATFFGSKLH
jgi:hypothetical protein